MVVLVVVVVDVVVVAVVVVVVLVEDVVTVVGVWVIEISATVVIIDVEERSSTELEKSVSVNVPGSSISLARVFATEIVFSLYRFTLINTSLLNIKIFIL